MSDKQQDNKKLYSREFDLKYEELDDLLKKEFEEIGTEVGKTGKEVFQLMMEGQQK